MSNDSRWRTDLSLGPVLSLSLGLASCNGDPPPATDGDGTGTDTDPPGASSGSSSSSAAADETGTSTSGDPPQGCPARRHSLLFEDRCGRIAFGDLDADGEDDLLVVADPDSLFALDSDKRIYGYPGTDPLLGAPEVHCCIEGGPTSSAIMLDVNGDGRDDPVLGLRRNVVTGDVGQNYEDLDLQIRGPLGGFLGQRLLVRLPDVFGATPRATAGDLLPGGSAVAIAEGQLLGLYVAVGLSLAAPKDRIALGEDIRDLVALDLDGDGIDDLVALLDTRVAMALNDGDGTLTAMGDSVPPLMGSRMHLGDLDGEEPDDLLVLGSEGLAVGRFDGGMPSWSTQALVPGGPVALADVDGDGTTDLVTTAGPELVAHLGAGDGTFTVTPTALSTGVGENVRDLGAGDLDGNGRSELVVCDELGVLVMTP